MSKLTVISFQSLRSSSMTKKSILSKSNATSNRYRRTKLFQMMLTMMYWLRLRRHVRHSSTNHPNSGILFEKVTKSMRIRGTVYCLLECEDFSLVNILSFSLGYNCKIMPPVAVDDDIMTESSSSGCSASFSFARSKFVSATPKYSS